MLHWSIFALFTAWGFAVEQDFSLNVDAKNQRLSIQKNVKRSTEPRLTQNLWALVLSGYKCTTL